MDTCHGSGLVGLAGSPVAGAAAARPSGPPFAGNNLAHSGDPGRSRRAAAMALLAPGCGGRRLVAANRRPLFRPHLRGADFGRRHTQRLLDLSHLVGLRLRDLAAVGRGKGEKSAGPATVSAAAPVTAAAADRHGGKRLLRLGLLFLFLTLLVAGALNLFARANLALAKHEGVYTTAEDAVWAHIHAGPAGAQVTRVEGLWAGPSSPDGRLPHVWFGGGRVWLDRVPFGQSKDNYLAGSYYLRVEEGWVHLPEGALPRLVGWAMALFRLEGAVFTPEAQ